MATQLEESIPPALDLLSGIVARGPGGVSQRALVDDGWPAPAVSHLLDALRSRGYVRFDPATARWVATGAGVRRVDEARSPAATGRPGGVP
jgi:DNA-binding IclR family transcriptional regulator